MRQNRKNVLFIIPSFTSGGAENHSLYTAKALQEIDANLKVYFLAFGRTDESFISILKSNQIEAIHYSMNGFMNFSLLDKTVNLIKLFFLLNKYKFKYIFSGTLIPNMVGGVLWRFLRTEKFFWHQWGIDTRMNSSVIEKIAIKLKPSFISNSNACKQNLIDLYNVNAPIKIINNPVKSSILEKENSNNFESKPFKLLMVANFFDEKDHLTVLKAFSYLSKEKENNMTLTFIGKTNGGDNLNKIKATAFEIGLTNEEVIFEDQIDDICEIVFDYDLGILSSRSEGLSNALIEYMAAGLPVVCTNIPSNLEVVGEENLNFTFEIGNCEQLKSLIHQFYNNRQFARIVGKKNNQRANQLFTFEIYKEKIEALINSIIV